MSSFQRPRIPKPARTNIIPNLIHTTRPLLPHITTVPTTLHTFTSSTRTKFPTLPGFVGAPATRLTHQTHNPTNTSSMDDTSTSWDAAAIFIPFVVIFGTLFICTIVYAIASCRYWRQRWGARRAAAAATNGAQTDIYTQRREAFTRRCAAITRASTINVADIERGSQQQQQQQPGDGDVLPRYESLYGTREAGQEPWPLQELRPAPTRRVMTEPTPEGQGQGSTWPAPWTVAEGARKQ